MSAGNVPTAKVVAVAKGESVKPDRYDDLAAERRSALWHADSAWWNDEGRAALLEYAAACERLLAEVQAEEPEGGPVADWFAAELKEAAKFRIGDVVRLPCGREVRILERNEACAFVEGQSLGYFATQLTLLRRPVQVGDRLTKPGGCRAVGATDGGFGKELFTASELPKLERCGRWSIHGMWIDVGGICHADGTPIDPPSPEAKPSAKHPLTVAVEAQRAALAAPIPTTPSGRIEWLQLLHDEGHISKAAILEMFDKIAESPALTARQLTNQWAQESLRAHLPPKPPCKRCGSGSTAAWGVTHNDGARFCGLPCHDEYDREVYGIDRRPHPSELPLTAERLARALWDGDEEVRRFLDRVAEVAPAGADVDLEAQEVRGERVADIAWTRDELGAKSRWTDVATAALARLGRTR